MYECVYVHVCVCVCVQEGRCQLLARVFHSPPAPLQEKEHLEDLRFKTVTTE